MAGRDEQILNAAERLFATRSFDGVGVDAIGQEAGISGSAIYRHFGSKDEILAALIDRAIDVLLLRTREVLADPHEELRHLIEVYVDFAISHRHLAYIAQQELRALSRERRDALIRRQRAYFDRWVAAIDACYPGYPLDQRRVIARALHALITSDAGRVGGGSKSPALRSLLIRLALGAADSLGDPGAATPPR